MATYQISMLGGSTVPDTTGRCWFETYDTIATNDVWKHLVIRFKNPTANQAHGIYGQFTVPQNYVGTSVIIPVWTTTATTGNHQWRITYRTVGGDDTTSLDQTSNEQQTRQADVAPGAANRRLTPSISVTAANFAAGETVEFLFERQDNASDDTCEADSVLFDLLFQYADV
jgi:predicted carbohydrate-binding protein with CBM5 and CBM33 domain